MYTDTCPSWRKRGKNNISNELHRWEERCHCHGQWAPRRRVVAWSWVSDVYWWNMVFLITRVPTWSRVISIESRPQTLSSPLTRVRSRRLILNTLSYHPRWCSYGVRVTWSYLSCDTHHMYWLTLVYTYSFSMYVLRVCTYSVYSCCMCIMLYMIGMLYNCVRIYIYIYVYIYI